MILLQKKNEDITSHDILSYLFRSETIISYLEIGVREGGSLINALCTNEIICSFFTNKCFSGQSITQQELDDIFSNYIPDPKKIELYLCDTWGSCYGGSNRKTSDFIENLLFKYLQYSKNNVHILSGDSKQIIPSMQFPAESIDIIYVDGDHSYNGAMTDLENCYHIFRKYLIFDDIYHPAHLDLQNCLIDFTKNHSNLKYDLYGKNTNIGTAIIYKI